MPARFAFGISQFTTKPWTFDEDVARYAALGVVAIEVVEAKLDEHRWAEQMASVAAAGLRISGVQPAAAGLCLDYWNIWQQADATAAIERAAGRIVTVQASDWRTPRSFADRLVPGEGAIPLAELISATRATTYDRPYVVEIFSDDVADRLYDADPADVIRRSRAGLDAAWNAAG